MDIAFIARLCGIAGLLLITYGILVKGEKQQNILFIMGGIGLLAYSISLKDPVFVPLQIVFISASVYDIYAKRKK